MVLLYNKKISLARKNTFSYEKLVINGGLFIVDSEVFDVYNLVIKEEN